MPDYQLSLAIGKEGQNVRLAARLTGWRIDIQPDNQAEGDVGGTGARTRAGRRQRRSSRPDPAGRQRPGGQGSAKVPGAADAPAL